MCGILAAACLLAGCHAPGISAPASILWTSGTGHEIFLAMAAPVLGGLLIADDAVDIFAPTRFLVGPPPPKAEDAWARLAPGSQPHCDLPS
jgi:hypothetical protein